MLRDNWVFRRGDIYMANLNPFRGSEQGGTRPVLVLQNDTGNFHSPTLIVTPLTTQEKKNLPTHCRLGHTKGLNEPSVALLEQIKTIDKCRITRYLGKLTEEQMLAVEQAVQISLGIIQGRRFDHDHRANEKCGCANR